jgi:H+-transporting ATPase
MFLQLVAGGHFLLFITRTEPWVLLPPFPALVLTEILAALMCGFGGLVPQIPWSLIGWVRAYNIVWIFVLGGFRLIAERFAGYHTRRQAASVDVVNQALRIRPAS